MTFEIALMLLLLGLALVAFVREIFPLEVTALGLLGVLLASGLVTPEQAISGFCNKAVVTIGALFVLSHALTRTGLIDAAADRLGHWARERRWLGVGALLLTVSMLSGFLNNTAVVAIFIPLTIGLCRTLELSPSKILIPLSYASIFGGTLTLIGTSTNLLVSEIAQQAGERPFTMFELTRLGIVFLLLGLAYILIFARRLLPDRVRAGDLTRKYQLGDYLTEVKVTEGSPLIGRSCRQEGIGERFDVNVLAVLRGDQRFAENPGMLPLEEGDVLIVQGNVDELLRLRSDLGLALLPDVKLSDAELGDAGQITAEVLVTPRSRLVGRTLAQVDFRRHYGGFVMAIRHHGTALRKKVAHTLLRAWDSLLMLVPPDRLEDIRRDEGFIVLAEHRLALRRERGWWLVLVILPLVVLLSALKILEIVAGALLGAVLLLLAGTIRPRHAYRSIDWSVLFLIAAFVPVGQAFIVTGTADFIAEGILKIAAVLPMAAPYAVVALVYLITSLLTQMISNAAAAIILTPLALSLATTLTVDPRPFLVAICFAASAEFMTPMGYQTNMMVYAPGGYRFLDYTRFGAPLNILFWLLASVLIPRLWSF